MLITGIVILLGILGGLKYYNFFADNWNMVFSSGGILPQLQAKDLILPLGISFYTLQAIGYMIDVFWEKADVHPNPGKTALFLSFFPLIMEGPISPYGQIADDLWKGNPIRFQNLSDGCIRIVWGMFKKLIIADRLNVLVGTIFGDYENYHGAMIAVAAIAYTIQLYMEFSGCMDIVIGSGRIFGIKLPENFKQPFFAKSAADFWRRWHISLGVWFRTYIFYPVSLSVPVRKWNRFAKKRFGKYVARTGAAALALFPVWLCNGLWHGPSWRYIFYGMYYFVLLFLGEAIGPGRDALLKKLSIRKEAMWYQGIQILKTWVIIFVGELFFRADGLRAGIKMFRSMFDGFSFRQLTAEAFLQLGLDKADYIAVAGGCIVVLIVDILKERQTGTGILLEKVNLPVRWGLSYVLIFSVVLLGAYGIEYEPVDLIYAGF